MRSGQPTQVRTGDGAPDTGASLAREPQTRVAARFVKIGSGNSQTSVLSGRGSAGGGAGCDGSDRRAASPEASRSGCSADRAASVSGGCRSANR